jgi:regulatory protein
VAGTVTALEFQKRNKDRVNVYLDGEFAFGLNALEAARLHRGAVLSDAEIEQLQSKDAIAKAYDRAVAFLSYRPRSIAETRRNLAEKETAAEVIEAVIARLTEQGYLDDAAFADFWVRNRLAFKPLGARALRFELREKGLESGIIDEALATLDTHENAYQAALPKARRLGGQGKQAFRQKLGAFLARRGFDYDAARAVTDRLIEELGEEDPAFFATSPASAGAGGGDEPSDMD